MPKPDPTQTKPARTPEPQGGFIRPAREDGTTGTTDGTEGTADAEPAPTA